MDRKGFGPRLLAAIIDAFIILAFGCVAGAIFGTGFHFQYGGSQVTGPSRAADIVGALLGLAYASTEIFLAGSPGKLILKMKIGSDTAVVPAPQDVLIKRWAIKWSPSILHLLFVVTTFRLFNWLAGIAGLAIIVGCFFALGQNRQALHDVLARTAVYGLAPVTQQGFDPVMPAGPYATPGVHPPPPIPGSTMPPPPPPPPPVV